MKNKIKKSIILLFTLTYILAVLSFNVHAGSNVDISPEQPKPLDKMMFNVTITEVENITKAVIVVKECGIEADYGYVCYTDGFNETMNKANNDTFTAEILLKHENATEIKYQIGYLTNNSWIWEPSNDMIIIQLNTPHNLKPDEDNGIPGFELIFMIISVIFISLLFNTRRR